jgi:hypothetical protein
VPREVLRVDVHGHDAGRMHITEFNQYVEKPMEEYGIDYKYYYKEVMKEIRLLEKPQQKATLIFDDNER